MISKTKFNRLKRGMCVYLLFALPVLCFGNDQVTALFEKGNALYGKGKYREAAAAYQQIISDGYQSATVYYNLGNAFYKLDEIPSALLYFEKAHKLDPGDEDINFNIQYTNLKTTDKVDEVPQFFITKWWNGFILLFSVGTLSVLSILFLLTGFAILAYYLFTQSVALKKASFYSALVLILFGFITVFISNRQLNYFEVHQQAIIFGSSVRVHSEPSETSKSLFVIHEGARVEVSVRNSGWVKVKLANGNEGWIGAADAKDI